MGLLLKGGEQRGWKGPPPCVSRGPRMVIPAMETPAEFPGLSRHAVHPTEFQL